MHSRNIVYQYDELLTIFNHMDEFKLMKIILKMFTVTEPSLRNFKEIHREKALIIIIMRVLFFSMSKKKQSFFRYYTVGSNVLICL